MGWRDTVSNIATLGGHHKLQNARAEYADTHSRYLLTLESEKAYRARLELVAQSLGAMTVASFRALKGASKLVSRGVRRPINLDMCSVVLGPTLPDFGRIEKLIVRYSETKAAAGGIGVGSAAVIGSWSAVSVLGTASTGTAISTLSGVAFTNATFAWFGGGSLAVGGAGIVGGTALLGGIALAPIFGFMSWRSRAKAGQIANETVRIKHENQRLKQAIAHHAARLSDANTAKERLLGPSDTLIAVYRHVRQELFPVIFVSYFIRQIRALFGGIFYFEDELILVNQLNDAMMSFESVWRIK